LSNAASKQFLTVTEPGGEPRLTATRENGQVQLTLTGKQGSRYAIETSTALPNWTSANLTITVTNQGGAGPFPDRYPHRVDGEDTSSTTSPRSRLTRACVRKSSTNDASKSFLTEAGAEKKIKSRNPA